MKWRPCWIPKDWKLLFCPTETRSRTFQLEARGTKSIVYGQYGSRANKAHFDIQHEQEPMSRSLHLPCKPYKSTFARIFLFLERHEFFASARTV